MKRPKERRKGGSSGGIYRAFVENEGAIKGLLRRLLYKQEDIDEIAQETFLRAYVATRGRRIDSPKAYVFKVARSLAFDELSRKTRKLTDYLEEAVKADEATTATLEDEAVGHQHIELYFDAIAELPSQCRKVFLMRKLQALPHKAIAKQLGISESAVQKHIARGTLGCKQYLAKRMQGGKNTEGAGDEPVSGDMVPKGQTHE